MTDSTHIFDRFKGYSTEDCACEYCLYIGKKGRCLLNECCCAEERQTALEREHEATNGLKAPTETEPCRGWPQSKLRSAMICSIPGPQNPRRQPDKIAPAGYQLDVINHKHIIITPDEAAILTFANVRTNFLKITKVDTDTGVKLAGAVLRVALDGGSKFFDVETDASGTATLPNLPNGTWVVTEIMLWPLLLPNDRSGLILRSFYTNSSCQTTLLYYDRYTEVPMVLLHTCNYFRWRPVPVFLATQRRGSPVFAHCNARTITHFRVCIQEYGQLALSTPALPI